jgi:hypothetical protein
VSPDDVRILFCSPEAVRFLAQNLLKIFPKKKAEYAYWYAEEAFLEFKSINEKIQNNFKQFNSNL